MDRSAAVVANQILNTLLRALKVEMEISEREEIIERMDQLEAELGRRSRGA